MVGVDCKILILSSKEYLKATFESPFPYFAHLSLCHVFTGTDERNKEKM